MNDEPERRLFNQMIAAAPATYVSAASLLETRIVLFAQSGDSAVLALNAFLLKTRMSVAEVSLVLPTSPSMPIESTARGLGTERP